MSSTSIRRALISVSDKSHLATLVPMLQQHQIEVVSSGGQQSLEDWGNCHTNSRGDWKSRGLWWSNENTLFSSIVGTAVPSRS